MRRSLRSVRHSREGGNNVAAGTRVAGVETAAVGGVDNSRRKLKKKRNRERRQNGGAKRSCGKREGLGVFEKLSARAVGTEGGPAEGDIAAVSGLGEDRRRGMPATLR